MELKVCSRYPEYKSSGVDWLGEIPSQWGIKRLKYVSRVNPRSLKAQIISDNLDVTFLPMEAIGEGFIQELRSKPAKDVVQGYTPFLEGDILIAKITPCFENGKGAIASGLENGVGFGTTELHVLRAGEQMDNRFLHYLTHSWQFRKLGEASMQGAAGQKRVADAFVCNFIVPVPSLEEQRAITDFLDRETARIDILVAKCVRLVNALEDKRVSIISQAMKRGIDTKTGMKQSGVDLLGVIPESWVVKRLKNVVTKIGSGKTPTGGSEIYGTEGVLFIRSQNVHFDGLHLDDVVYISESIDNEMASTRVQPTDVLLNITGASLGRATIVPPTLPKANVNQHVAIIRPDKTKIHPSFLNLVITSHQVQAQIFSSENGSAREGLPYSKTSNIVFAMPVGIAEQERVVRYVKEQTAELNQSTEKIQRLLSLLREYRYGLIASAITGKIDVREVE